MAVFAKRVTLSNVRRERGTPATGGLIFLSVGSEGAPGPLNTAVLGQLKLDISHIPGSKDLLKGYAILERGNSLLCFVVTVGQSDTRTVLASNLQRALRDSRLKRAKSLWIPLMGTGAGGLSFEESDEIITAALSREPWCNAPDVKIVIAYPSEDSSGRYISLPQSSEVRLAIQLAWKLHKEHQKPGPSVTTSLLFFALIESQANPNRYELSGDSPAAILRAAVLSMAGESRYRASWLRYFGKAHIEGSDDLPSFDGELSPNVKAILGLAEHRAAAQGRRSIEVDDLIRSLLSYEKGRFLRVLEPLDLSADQLLRAYGDAMAGSIATVLLNDVASRTDRLGYATYAKAITSFLRDPKTPSPLSISIQAPWGAGKSSLMQQIREDLDPRVNREQYKQKLQGAAASFCHITLKQALFFLDRKLDPATKESNRGGRFLARIRNALTGPGREQTTPESADLIKDEQFRTVWFNAWKYDTSEQVWSGLVDAIVSQISDRLPPEERELFLFRLQLARIDDGIVRRKIYDRILTIWWNAIRKWFFLGAGAVAAFVGANHFMASAVLAPGWRLLIASSPATATSLLAVYLFFTYRSSSERTKSEPASFSLAPYLKVPDYDQSLGSIHHIHKDLLRVLSLKPCAKGTSESLPIVIFIDDLDRCSPSKVASVVEGVNMFLASDDYKCIFVIGMDPQMIAAALEEAHAKVLDQLPSFECTVPLGWRFMDKFIQLPFTIPPSADARLQSYIDWLAAPEVSVDEQNNPVPSPPLTIGTTTSSNAPSPASSEEVFKAVDGAIDTLSPEERFRESRDVGAIIREAAASTSGNPREIKRLTNLARLYLGLRNARQRDDVHWQAPGLSQYARWITLTLRWPDMMRWLQWGADERSWGDDTSSRNLQVRRLDILQQIAASANNLKNWEEGVAHALKISSGKTTGWVNDAKLFEFFKNESHLKGDERLSAAAARGFW